MFIAGVWLLTACGGGDGGTSATPTSTAGVAGEPTAAPTVPAALASPTAEPTVDPSAEDAGVPPSEIYLGSGQPPDLSAGDIALLDRLQAAVPQADDLGAEYVQTRGGPLPNYRLLDMAADRDAMRQLLLATARENGYRAQFDHLPQGGPEQVQITLDLFANPTGASIAVRRAGEFVAATTAERSAPEVELGAETAFLRYTFSAGVGYEVVVRRGRIVGRVLVTYRADPGGFQDALPIAQMLHERLVERGL
jgi:hypothetical protein